MTHTRKSRVIMSRQSARVEPNVPEGELPIYGHLDPARFLGTFPELSQDLPVGRSETCRMRPDGRQWTSL